MLIGQFRSFSENTTTLDYFSLMASSIGDIPDMHICGHLPQIVSNNVNMESARASASTPEFISRPSRCRSFRSS